jgi:cob(I)alamin adenosyltransferase
VSNQPASPEAKPEIKQVISPEEEKIRSELQNIFIDLLTSAQELSYEIATLEPKDSYTKDEIKDLLDAGRRVVANVKKMHQFLKAHTPKR